MEETDEPRASTGANRFLRIRTSAMKEIQAWVRKDTNFTPDMVRASGLMSENVTEERMLKSKLLELSKERYKFIMQNKYEQMVFQERQRRKAELRRVVSASVDGEKRYTVSSRSNATRTNPSRNTENVQAKPPAVAAYEKRIKSHSVLSENTGTIVEAPTVKVTIDRSPPEVGFQTNPPQETRAQANPSPEARHHSYRYNSRQLSQSVESDRRTSTTSQAPTLMSGADSKRPSTSDLPTWIRAKKVPSKYGERITSRTSDPRYAMLEQRLCPVVQGRPECDVASLVASSEALHAHPKTKQKDFKKSKIELKALEYFKRQGYVF
ncbi:uncharacterized protein LOC131948551 [Physella acuta]|uniref:uncharacterized protein LOC131948551 n=1 Tax=Physella acuta TaxID=109671 RepID=UPI0027DBE812|nr:uncharacterized protein LOC131948551 [Physella acuta]XP_059166119.1 uncharacterized protein LOC131948551 [Physella acuta]